MILILVIICSILYLIMIYAVLSLYYKYRKDIEEIEKRCLQLEKRDNEKASRKDLDGVYDTFANSINEITLDLYQLKNKKCKCRKEVK